ncbi:MAG: tyrosine-type recombinase/integrase [Bacteroidetes bacterium]|nr:tyrosine-type recombinase/integrase [Bacteroidota bacterium]
MKHLPIFNPEFENFYTDFHSFTKTKGYSRGKDSMYPSCVREFLYFIELKQITDIKVVTAKEIIGYYEYLLERPNQKREGGLSDSTIKGHLFSLRLFFDYLLDMDVIDSTPARLPKFVLKKFKERNILSLDEIIQLYEVCETRQDKALLSLAYGCGLRRSEIEKLDTSDLHIQSGVIVIRDSKNHRSRTIPLADNVLRDLKEYILYERMKYINVNKPAQPAFFINNTGLRKKGDKFNIRLKQLIERTKNSEILNKNITLHCLRHSIATHLLDNGATIEFVQHFLGHSQIDTAHIYSKRRMQRMKILSQI